MTISKLTKLANKFELRLKQAQQPIPDWFTKYQQDKKTYWVDGDTAKGIGIALFSNNPTPEQSQYCRENHIVITRNMNMAFSSANSDARFNLAKAVLEKDGKSVNQYSANISNTFPERYLDPNTGFVYSYASTKLENIQIISKQNNQSQQQKQPATDSSKLSETNKQKLDKINNQYKTVGGFIIAMEKYMDKSDSSDVNLLSQMKQLQIKINDVISKINRGTLEVDVSNWISKVDGIIGIYSEYPAILKAYGK